MKIKRIQIKNFMGLREIDIAPKGTNVINGRNRQGKTSLLKAIEAAFKGGDQTVKIRNGESSAEILIETDEIFVSKNIQLGDDTLLDVNDVHTGEAINKPQSFLNSVIGGFSFNPAAFFAMDSKKQREYILESLPMRLAPDDVTEWTGRSIPLEFQRKVFLDTHGLVLLNRITKYYYDLRTTVNREVDRLTKAGTEQAKLVPADFDLESFDPDGLQALYEQVRKAEAATNRIATLQGSKARVESEILKLERDLKMKRIELDTVKAELDPLLQEKPVDVKGLEKQIAEHETTRKIAEAAESLVQLRVDYQKQKTEANALDGIIGFLRKDGVAELCNRVQWPVPNMAVTDDGLTFDGKVFDMLSGAEQIAVALQIAKALNGDFHIVCVDGVERLDEQAFAEFIAQMEADEVNQYFVTVVGNREPAGAAVFTIEDGVVMKPTKKTNGVRDVKKT